MLNIKKEIMIKSIFENREVEISRVNTFREMYAIFLAVHPYWCIAREEVNFKYYKNNNNLTKCFYLVQVKNKSVLHEALFCCHIEDNGSLYFVDFHNHRYEQDKTLYKTYKSLIETVRQEISKHEKKEIVLK